MDKKINDQLELAKAEYGDQAYWQAVEFATIACHLSDIESAELWTAVSKELMKEGYHNNNKKGFIFK